MCTHIRRGDQDIFELREAPVDAGPPLFFHDGLAALQSESYEHEFS